MCYLNACHEFPQLFGDFRLEPTFNQARPPLLHALGLRTRALLVFVQLKKRC